MHAKLPNLNIARIIQIGTVSCYFTHIRLTNYLKKTIIGKNVDKPKLLIIGIDIMIKKTWQHQVICLMLFTNAHGICMIIN
jgi:hypothetical protein